MTTLSLIGEIRPDDISARFVRDALAELGDGDEIEMLLHSDGGDVVEGFAIFHQLLAHRARIVAHVQGLAASMASVVLMAADEIRIAESSFLAIHNPFFPLLVGVEAKDLRHGAELLDAFKANAVRAYRRHSPLSDEEISALMDAETWLTAEEAVEKGFAHLVTDRVEIVNRLDLSRFERVPQAARALFAQPSQGEPNMREKNKPEKPPADAPEIPPAEAVSPDETVESLWSRLGQMIFRRTPEPAAPSTHSVAVLAEERAALAEDRLALRTDRARLHLDGDLKAHRATIEPGQLEKLEPVLLELKAAELAGDANAATQYANLTALLPALASNKTAGELAASDAGALSSSLELPAERKAVDQRRGITDERREALMQKYTGCRPGAVQEIR